MKEVLPYLQNLGAIAFFLLGVATVVVWLRHRDRSLLFLGLAIVLLSLVSLLGRIAAVMNFSPPLLTELSLVAFMASGYALLLYRDSMIPLRRAWHVIALATIAATTVAYETAQALSAPKSLVTWAGVVLVLAWSATVVEPIVRFWLVARGLPAVPAWRLRTLSLGFAGLVALLLFAGGRRAAIRQSAGRGAHPGGGPGHHPAPLCELLASRLAATRVASLRRGGSACLPGGSAHR